MIQLAWVLFSLVWTILLKSFLRVLGLQGKVFKAHCSKFSARDLKKLSYVIAVRVMDHSMGACQTHRHCEFAHVYCSQAKFNTGTETDKFGQVRAKIANVRELALENVERALARGERLEVLVDKSEALSSGASRFQKTAKKVRDVFWWRNARTWGALAVLLLLVAFIVTGLACHWKFGACFR